MGGELIRLFNRLLFKNLKFKMSTAAEFYQHFPHYTWDFTPKKLEDRTTALISKVTTKLDEIVKFTEPQISFKSVCQEIADLETEIEFERNLIEIYLNASPNSEIREKTNELTKTLSNFIIEISLRKDIFDILHTIEKKNEKLDIESKRYLDKSILYRKRDGLALEEKDRTKMTELLKEISELCIDFNRNIAEENTILKFAAAELDGMTKDFFDGLKKDDDKYETTLKYPHVIPILKHCKNPKTRQTVEKAYNSRCIDKNIAILKILIELRDVKRQLLGYKTHADYVTEILMSKNAETVRKFLSDLHEKLQVATKKELARLLELKEIEYKEMGVDFDHKFYPFDSSYYQNMVEERDFKVDTNLIKEYFPLDHVTARLMEIYQTLLSLRFVKVEGTSLIHSEVSLYAVFDKKSNELLGYFYLDLFPRDGKYTHAACFGMQSAVEYRGKRQVGCAAMIANFTKPLSDKPSLLTHSEVETYFHEFGHVMHHICSQTKFSMFHGTSVERDFVEAPSQMLENWVWEKESLKKISCHYKSKKPLSDDLIHTLCESRKANISLFYVRQICLATFDQIIHSTPKVDTFEVYKECMLKYIGFEPTPGTNFAAAFGHMAGGYDAQYYGYLWSQVYSFDMFFSRFKKEGIFDPKTGMDYRTKILFPGSTKDGSELIRDFLHRDPKIDAMLEIAGIKC